MKTIRTNQVKRHFTHLVQHEQHEVIAKHLTYCKVLFLLAGSLSSNDGNGNENVTWK